MKKNNINQSIHPRQRSIFILEIISLVLIIVMALGGGTLLGFIISEVKNQTALKKLIAFQPKVPTRLYDVKGELISELFREKRDLVTFNELPNHLINAFLAVEDSNFYNHFGIDFMGVARAAIKNIRAGRIVEGGSTLTQQLAKGLFTEGEKTFMRKIVEAVYALQIEKEYAKSEILTMYMNQIYFGHGSYGVKSAARFYFGKEVMDLSLVEGAILASLPKAPHRFSPIRSTHNSYQRNRIVLNLMVQNGFVSQEMADENFANFWPNYLERIKTRPPTETAFGQKIDKAPYFTEYVRQILVSRFGEDRVYNEGFKVYTTLDLKRHRAAQKHLWSTLDRYDESSKSAHRYNASRVDMDLFAKYRTLMSIFPLPTMDVSVTQSGIYQREIKKELVDMIDGLALSSIGGNLSYAFEQFRQSTSGFISDMHVQGALISIEPDTGFISAMVGGTPFSVTNQFNRAIQARRQPGSAFKPFVYAAALDSRAYSTGSVELDSPLTHITMDGATWTPENYGQKNRGPVYLARALAMSLNVVSVRIFDRIGPDRIIDIASRMMKVPSSRFDPSPSLSLGGSELTPYEMATGFAIFANKGKEVIPFAIRFINDRDNLEVANIEREIRQNLAIKELDGSIQILPESLNWIMTYLLQNNIRNGTAGTVNHAGFRRPVGGKTGTTSNWLDGWFAGITPDLASVIWMGYDDRSMSLGQRGSGGSSAAPLFGRYMVDALAGEPVSDFPPQPEGVFGGGFCSICNGYPSQFCPPEMRHHGYHLKGFGASSCPKERWEFFEYSTVNQRFQQVEGISEDLLRQRLEERFLGGELSDPNQNN